MDDGRWVVWGGTRHVVFLAETPFWRDEGWRCALSFDGRGTSGTLRLGPRLRLARPEMHLYFFNPLSGSKWDRFLG
jgi:hypothetical protein